MPNNITKRYLECYNELIAKKKVKNGRQFSLSLNFAPQSWSKIQNNERQVTIDLIHKAVIKYKFNPVYIFTGVGEKFLNNTDNNGGILAVTVDKDNKERIVHVPRTAKAGYLDQSGQPVFMKNLKTYTLPGNHFNMGTFRSFEVEGDSMEPTLKSGDIVICSYVENPVLWETNIRDGYVYVIITKDDIVVKRVINRLKTDNVLELHSDNKHYPPVIVHFRDIKEIWTVKMKLSIFANLKTDDEDNVKKQYEKILKTLKNQEEKMEKTNKLLELLLQKQRLY